MSLIFEIWISNFDFMIKNHIGTRLSRFRDRSLINMFVKTGTVIIDICYFNFDFQNFFAADSSTPKKIKMRIVVDKYFP